MTIRRYDETRDKEAAYRIWREVGWMERDTKVMDLFMDGADAWVSTLRDEAECLVMTDAGDVRYIDQDLFMASVSAVTTSRVARRQGLAGKTTAHALAACAQQGAALAALGMFEQGYYDRLGFGTGPYEHRIWCAPSKLNVPHVERPPHRLDDGDWEAILANRLARRRTHGGVCIPRAGVTREALEEHEHGFGLGYYDASDGSLSHHVWIHTSHVEHGPYHVLWMAYQTPQQLLELLGVLKGLGAQVDLISICEHDGLELQTLIDTPFQGMRQSEDGKQMQKILASAWWQMRILALKPCIEVWTQSVRKALRFNLNLSDPIEHYLSKDSMWRGVAGAYTLNLAPGGCSIEAGHEDGLPLLSTSVGSLTRLWIGAASAWALALQPDFDAPMGLIDALDTSLQTPIPRMGWDL